MRQSLSLLVGCVALFGCSESTGPVTPSPPLTQAIRVAAGDNQSVAVGSSLPQSVEFRAVDSGGNGLAGVTMKFSIAGGAGSVSPDSAVTDASGIARVRWTVGRLSGVAQSLLATVRLSDAVVVSALAHAEAFTGAPLSLTKNSGDNQGADVGVPLLNPLAVIVTDEFGNRVAGASVAWTVAAGSAEVSPNPSISDPTGVARAAVVLRDTQPAVINAKLGVVASVQFNVRPNPVHSSNLRFATISAGAAYTCGISTTARAYCWGEDARLELGNGIDRSSGDPRTIAHWSYPIEVAGNLRFRRIDTESGVGSHTCAITTDSALYCWGNDYFGQLGIAGVARETNVALRVAPELSFSEVSVGQNLTCALTVAGKAYCWGWNQAYGLGNGTTIDANVPQPVSTELRFTSIYAGVAHACALTADGSAYCWGWDAAGELHAQSPCILGLCATAPVQLFPGFKFSLLSSDALCGIALDGTAYCWGRSNAGQIGNGQKDGGTLTVPTAVSGNHSFLAIDSGVGDFRCGLTTTREVFCWGLDYDGNLGAQPTETCTFPTGLITRPCSSLPVHIDSSVNFTALSTSNTHSCAISVDFVVYCWGDNGYGALGQATPSSSRTPLRVVDQ